MVERELVGICKQTMLELSDILRDYIDHLHPLHKNFQDDVHAYVIIGAKEVSET